MRSEDREIGSRLDHLNNSLVEVRCIVRGQRPFNEKVKNAMSTCNEVEHRSSYSSSTSDHDSDENDSDGELRAQEEGKTAATESGKTTPTSCTKQKKSQSSLAKFLLQLQRTTSPQRPHILHRRSSATLPVSWPTGSKVGPVEGDEVCRSHSFGSMVDEPSPGATKVHKLFRWGPKKLQIQDHDSAVPQVITNKYAEQ